MIQQDRVRWFSFPNGSWRNKLSLQLHHHLACCARRFPRSLRSLRSEQSLWFPWPAKDEATVWGVSKLLYIIYIYFILLFIIYIYIIYYILYIIYIIYIYISLTYIYIYILFISHPFLGEFRGVLQFFLQSFAPKHWDFWISGWISGRVCWSIDRAQRGPLGHSGHFPGEIAVELQDLRTLSRKASRFSRTHFWC